PAPPPAPAEPPASIPVTPASIPVMPAPLPAAPAPPPALPAEVRVVAPATAATAPPPPAVWRLGAGAALTSGPVGVSSPLLPQARLSVERLGRSAGVEVDLTLQTVTIDREPSQHTVAIDRGPGRLNATSL